MSNLEINMEHRDDSRVLQCIGRLDASRAGHLNDYIDRLVREGHYHISLDLTGLEYLSSTGIRSLLTQHRNLKAVNGYLYIETMSDYVRQILTMAGLADTFNRPSLDFSLAESKEVQQVRMEEHGFAFNFSALLPGGKTVVELYGRPELMRVSGYTSHDARSVESEDHHFAFGLGAIGSSYDECRKRFGEYLMVGKNIAYLPADGSKKPDYIVDSGKFIASLIELYGLHFRGNFSHLVRFDPLDSKNTIGISQLAESFFRLSECQQMALVMVAESGGLIGTSLNASPVDGRKIFTFPEIKDAVNFTTEQVHNKMLTLSVGFLSYEKNTATGRFLRPMIPGAPLTGHIHTAVFPYVPLKKKDIDLNETIEYLFNTSELTDILHLTNDAREIAGLGESQFVHGFCWIVPVESAHYVSNK
jgi:anti-sigma B factor antagonist